MKTFSFILIFASLIFPQDYYTKFDELGFTKIKTVDSLIFANAKIEEDTILVFWTSLFNNTFADDSVKIYENTNSIIFLLYRQYGEDFVQIIFNDKITQLKNIKSNRIFNYKNIDKTGAIKSEDGLLFKISLESSLADIVLYYTPKLKFYFEYGPGIEIRITADDNRAKFREEWINIIKGELKNLLKTLF